MEYEITQADRENAEKNSHISTEEIERDIRDTEDEIFQWEREETGLRMIGDKISVFRADGRRSRIREAKAFIDKLKRILAVRRVDSTPAVKEEK